MKVLIHASLDFKNEILAAKEYIEKNQNLLVTLPDLNRYQHIRDELDDDIKFTEIKNRLSRQNMELVEECDFLLILNLTHRGITNYVGGNSFLEMAIAFYLRKPIYMLNDIPIGMSYTEEIKSFYPQVVYSLENFIHSIKY